MRVKVKKKEMSKHHKKYLCINCKVEFNSLPIKTRNECISGYYHKFVETKNIIEGDKFMNEVQENIKNVIQGELRDEIESYLKELRFCTDDPVIEDIHRGVVLIMKVLLSL